MPPRALIVRDCARGARIAAPGRERNGSLPYPRNRCKRVPGMLRLIHPWSGAGRGAAGARGLADAGGRRVTAPGEIRFSLFYCPHGSSSILRLKFMHCTMFCFTKRKISYEVLEVNVTRRCSTVMLPSVVVAVSVQLYSVRF